MAWRDFEDFAGNDGVGAGTVIGQSHGIPGTITLVQHKKGLFAVKKYVLEKPSNEQGNFAEESDQILSEVVRMRQIRHVNILPCLHSYVSSGGAPEVCLVTPFMTLGSVRSLMDSSWQQGIPEPACSRILLDVTNALAYLHSKLIIHRSVRCSHILLCINGDGSEGFTAKLSGLRYACSLHDPPGQGLQDRYDYPLHVAKTNLNWLSPEFLQQNLMGYNEKSDVYSLGVAACEMANGLVPFSEMPSTMMLIEKLRGASPKLLDCSTFAMDDESAIRAITPQQAHLTEMKQSNFATNQPGDSGVGYSSVGSSSMMTSFTAMQRQMSEATLEALNTKASVYANRTFTEQFHEFVDLCSLEASERPSSKQLLAHPFLSSSSYKKQLAPVQQMFHAYHQRIMSNLKSASQTLKGRPTDGGSQNHVADTLSSLQINKPEWEF